MFLISGDEWESAHPNRKGMVSDMEQLIHSALAARERAYCPYSGFAVGAALLTKGGSIYTGCNVENVAFSPSCCAERTAFFKAVSEGETEFERIVIVAGSVKAATDSTAGGTVAIGSVRVSGELEKTTPCGVCLQVMSEFCDPDTFEVVAALSADEYEVYRLRELLPHGFHSSNV